VWIAGGIVEVVTTKVELGIIVDVLRRLHW